MSKAKQIVEKLISEGVKKFSAGDRVVVSSTESDKPFTFKGTVTGPPSDEPYGREYETDAERGIEGKTIGVIVNKFNRPPADSDEDEDGMPVYDDIQNSLDGGSALLLVPRGSGWAIDTGEWQCGVTVGKVTVGKVTAGKVRRGKRVSESGIKSRFRVDSDLEQFGGSPGDYLEFKVNSRGLRFEFSGVFLGKQVNGVAVHDDEGSLSFRNVPEGLSDDEIDVLADAIDSCVAIFV